MIPVKILAHRGYLEIAPENTELAFYAANIFGFDGIEIDVHMTKDKQLVVIHDETVNRTSNGKGKLEDLTLDEIKTDIIHYKGIEQLIWNVHKQINPKAKIIYSSFNLKSLDILNKISESAILGFFCRWKGYFRQRRKNKKICKYIHPWFKSMLNLQSIESYKKIGLPINLWTFDKRNTNDEWTQGSNQSFEKISKMPIVYSLICNSKY